MASIKLKINQFTKSLWLEWSFPTPYEFFLSERKKDLMSDDVIIWRILWTTCIVEGPTVLYNRSVSYTLGLDVYFTPCEGLGFRIPSPLLS